MLQLAKSGTRLSSGISLISSHIESEISKLKDRRKSCNNPIVGMVIDNSVKTYEEIKIRMGLWLQANKLQRMMDMHDIRDASLILIELDSWMPGLNTEIDSVRFEDGAVILRGDSSCVIAQARESLPHGFGDASRIPLGDLIDTLLRQDNEQLFSQLSSSRHSGSNVDLIGELIIRILRFRLSSDYISIYNYTDLLCIKQTRLGLLNMSIVYFLQMTVYGSLIYFADKEVVVADNLIWYVSSLSALYLVFNCYQRMVYHTVIDVMYSVVIMLGFPICFPILMIIGPRDHFPRYLDIAMNNVLLMIQPWVTFIIMIKQSDILNVVLTITAISFITELDDLNLRESIFSVTDSLASIQDNPVPVLFESLPMTYFHRMSINLSRNRLNKVKDESKADVEKLDAILKPKLSSIIEGDDVIIKSVSSSPTTSTLRFRTYELSLW